MRLFQGSPDLSLMLSTSLASAQSLLHPPNSSPAMENHSFPELPHILPSSLFPPEWSHWLSMPPSALNWLGTDPKIPPSQKLPWANREEIQYPCSSAQGVTVIHRVPAMSAGHMPGTHPIHTASSTHNLQGARTPLLRQVISLSPSSCLCTVLKPFPKIPSTYHY